MLSRREFIKISGLWSAAALVPGFLRPRSIWAQTEPQITSPLACFAVLSDTHVAVPYGDYGYDSPYVDNNPGIKLHPESRFILEKIVADLNAEEGIDFVLVCGDLTKDSELPNHEAFIEVMGQCIHPVYVHPGNHDTIRSGMAVHEEFLPPDAELVDAAQFPELYQDFGYNGWETSYYRAEPMPGLVLFALDSSRYNSDGGELGTDQLDWLEQELTALQGQDKQIIVSLHHAVIDALPVEDNPLFKPLVDFMRVKESPRLQRLLTKYGVRTVFSGHVHVQDINYRDGIFGILTGSTVTHPVPYRIVTLGESDAGEQVFSVDSRFLDSFTGDADIAGQSDLYTYSRELLAEGTAKVFERILTSPVLGPLAFDPDDAKAVGDKAGEWFADLSQGGETIYTSLEDMAEGTSLRPGDPRIQVLALLANALVDIGVDDNRFSMAWPAAEDLQRYARNKIIEAEAYLVVLTQNLTASDYFQARTYLRLTGYEINAAGAYLDERSKVSGPSLQAGVLFTRARQAFGALQQSLQLPREPNIRVLKAKADRLQKLLSQLQTVLI